ncbi:phosphonate metabolism transcriptional regulator PhnF [Motilimonas eburnea]|uniref:phosphonate metabolism transcriptional regulator PhnF n=1 Tax=Motilimonas eburnea TaxID=1737488 RepID=UPI001E56817E|nr:phosphonate metabolism transcriptional regulator PhnF [Motilimonas eburnea]MCE2571259.1 phosphonate metabolism transcriptional regulator PhnF [Motilimonas eburnea]
MARYQEIAQNLEAEITQHYQAGQYLPPEQRLADRFQVNRHTLRRAIDELVAQGWLLRQHGKGVKVLKKPMRYPLHASAKFTDNILNLGAAPTSQRLQFGYVDACKDVADALAVPLGSKVIQLMTLRFLDNTPVSVIKHHFIKGNHEAALASYQSGSVHQLLAQQCQIQLRRKHTMIGAAMPNASDSDYLNMPAHSPLLTLRSINVNSQDTPFEFSISHTRAELLELSLTHPSEKPQEPALEQAL